MRLILAIALCALPSLGSTLSFNNVAIYPGKFVFISQTERSLAVMTDPSKALQTDLYTGVKSGLWIQAEDFADSPKSLTPLKQKFLQGYIKNLGSYKAVLSSAHDTVLLSDSSYSTGASYYHVLTIKSKIGSILARDTFSISEEAGPSEVRVNLYTTRDGGLVIERMLSTAMGGPIRLIRLLSSKTFTVCFEDDIGADGDGDPRHFEFQMDATTEKPMMLEAQGDRILLKKEIRCK